MLPTPYLDIPCHPKSSQIGGHLRRIFSGDHWLYRPSLPAQFRLNPQPDSLKPIPSRHRHKFHIPAAVLSTCFLKISVISVHPW